MHTNTSKFFYQYFCFDFYQCKGITWFPLKIKISKTDEITEKSIAESIICLLSTRTVHRCSSLMSRPVLALDFDSFLNKTVVLSPLTKIFIVRHKGNGFYFWFCKKNLRALRTWKNFSIYRANLLGQNEPRKGRGWRFTVNLKVDYHLLLMCMTISWLCDLCVFTGYIPIHSQNDRFHWEIGNFENKTLVT